MNVTKIKIKKDRVSIDYDKMVVVDEKELINKYSIDSPEHPTNPFKNAFQKLDFFLIELCELCDNPKDIPIMCEDVNITGLSFKYNESELSGAVITGTKELAYSNSPLVLNTPYKSVCIDEFDRMKHLTDPCIAALKSVIRHAINYVNGERLQIEMSLRDSVNIKDTVKVSVLQNDERPLRAETGDKKANPEKYPSHKTEIDPNAGKGNEKVQSENLGPKVDVSRETTERVKSYDTTPGKQKPPGLPKVDMNDVVDIPKMEDGEIIDPDTEIPKVPK